LYAHLNTTVLAGKWGSCHIHGDAVEACPAGCGPHASAIMASIPNDTDQTPVIQTSEGVVG
jgi:hypothetical protein